MSGDEYRPDIDGLRAVAVLGVIAFHTVPGVLPGGFTGVDVFFVISGFLITKILLGEIENGTFSIAAFYVRRIKRLFPALILVLTVCLAAGWFILSLSDYKLLGWHSVAGAGFFANFAVAKGRGYFDLESELVPLLHLWSLGVEEQFYIVWPWALFAMARWPRYLLPLTLAILLGSFTASAIWAETDPRVAFFNPLSRFWELLVGAVLAQAAARQAQLENTHFSNAASLVGAALIAAGMVLIDGQTPFPGVAALLPVSGAALMIAARPNAVVNRWLLAATPMVAIGLISYPLYLWHWPLLSFTRHLGFAADGLMAAVLLSFALAALTHLLIEKPVTQGFRRNTADVVKPLAAGMAAVLAMGLVTNYTTGFAFRFADDVQRVAGLASATGEFSKARYMQLLRRDQCLLLDGNDEDDWKKFDYHNCATVPGDGKPVIALIGDSHAAHLYPGLKRYYEGSAHIVQLTAAYYVAGIETPQRVGVWGRSARCQNINRAVFERLRELKPAAVIVSGNYKLYSGDELHYPNYLDELTAAVQGLKQQGIATIVVGQSPTWAPSLPRIVERMLRRGETLSEYVTTGLQPEVFDVERTFRQGLSGHSIQYLSVLDLLCRDQACRPKVGPRLPDDVLAVDYGHLSPSGSLFVARELIAPALAPTISVNGAHRAAR